MIRRCLNCNKEFEARTRVHRYCSPKCRMTSEEYKARYREQWAVMKDKYRKTEIVDIYCQRCNTYIGESPPISKKRKWCDECRKIVKSERIKEKGGYKDSKREEVNLLARKSEKHCKNWTKEELKELEKLYEKGVKLVDIAKKLQRTYGSVVKKLRVIYGKEALSRIKRNKDKAELDVYSSSIGSIEI